MRKGYLSVGLSLTILGCSIVGCGGGSGGGTTPIPPVTNATFQIVWPARSRAAIVNPLTSSLSVSVVLAGAGAKGADITFSVDRDATKVTGYTATYTISDSIETTALGPISAKFYAQPGEQGAVVGTASSTASLSGLQIQFAPIELVGTIKSVLVIAPSPSMSKASKPTQLAFSAMDSSKNVVAITPGSVSWNIASGSSFSLTTDGIASPTSAGTTTVTASVDGIVSLPTPITVVNSGLANTAWPKFRANPQNTAFGSANGATGNIRWSHGMNLFEYRFASSPCIGTDGSLYVGSIDGHLYALDAAAGTTLWSFTAGGAIESSPALSADGILFFGCDDGKVYAIQSSSGVVKWTFATGDQVQSSPSIGVDGTVYICSNDHYLYALDPTTGSQKWRFATSGTTTTSDSSSPAIGPDGTVYVGVEAGSGLGNVDFYAIDGQTGASKWTYKGGGYIGTPAVANGTVYAGTLGSKVEAMDSQTGTLKWSFSTNGTVVSSVAIAANGDVVASSGYQVYRLNASTGAQVWVFSIANNAYGMSCSPSIASDGTIYVSMHDGTFYALSGDTGAVNWQYGIGVQDSSPVIGPDGTVYISGQNLIAFH